MNCRFARVNLDKDASQPNLREAIYTPDHQNVHPRTQAINEISVGRPKRSRAKRIKGRLMFFTALSKFQRKTVQ